MSENYLPLFRKYRPQKFSDLVGQENLVKALTNAIELKRIANAYLFCGPRGTGKTSSARILAKSLNCIEGPTVEPCQKCASCESITNATGVDVIEIDAATNRGVEGAEDLIEQVHYAPVSGKYKIFIIDEVHMLTAAAFNALLKTFEEPPENVIFILATTEPHKVIETIVSRCQRFDFRRITVDDIVKRLKEISELENINIDEEALFTIAKNVSGGMRDSLALLDQVSILGAKEKITKETIEELLGKVTFDKLINLLDLIVSQDIEAAISLVGQIYEKGSEPRNLCENFLEFLRNVLIVINSKEPKDAIKFTTLNTSDIEVILGKNYDSSLCSKILDIAIEYYKEIKTAQNPYLWVELMIIKSAKANSQLTYAPQKTQQKAQEVNVQIEKPKVQEPKVEPKVQVQAEPIQNEPVKEEIQEIKEEPEEQEQRIETPSPINTQSAGDEITIWSNIVNSIESVPAKFFYSGMGKLIEISENKIVLGFINQNVIAQAKSDLKHKALIEGEKKAFGGKYIFEFVQLSENIKPLEGANIKPQIKQEPKQKADTSFKKPQENSQATEQDTLEEQENHKKVIDTSTYSPKIKDMLEALQNIKCNKLT